MRNFILLSLAAAAAGLVGCNNNPVTTYRIQVDESSLLPGSLPASCFLGATTSQTKDINPSERPEYVWTMWSAVSNYYLDTGTFNNKTLGNADPIKVSGAIDSLDGKLFDGKETLQDVGVTNLSPAGYSNTALAEMTVQFQTGGGAPQGTIVLTSSYTCTNCMNNDNKVSTCTTSLAFSGVSIPTTTLSAYPIGINGQ